MNRTQFLRAAMLVGTSLAAMTLAAPALRRKHKRRRRRQPRSEMLSSSPPSGAKKPCGTCRWRSRLSAAATLGYVGAVARN
jgi:hypothetical protein